MNSIKQSSSVGYSCNHCGKKHTRKTSHERHILLCEVIYSSKREKKCLDEETSNIPTHFELYKIVQELALKNSILEEKMAEMQKWLDKKKKKIDVVQWLSTNKSNIVEIFSEWQKKIIVTSDHIELLIEENIVKTICEIIHENIKNKDIPIICFQQKTNLFYIFNQNIETHENTWKRVEPQEFLLFIQHIHKKIWHELSHWKEKNNEKIQNSEKMCDLYARTVIKLTGLNFDQDSAAMCKIRSYLYNQLKTDLKNMIEYEFEF